jgi:hypothetical protein
MIGGISSGLTGGLSGGIGGGGGLGGLGGGGLSGIGGDGGGSSKVPGVSTGGSKGAILDRPSESKATADDLAARFAAGDNIDPHQLAIATAKAGVEMQMSTRTISQAVTAVRTLFQMQI